MLINLLAILSAIAGLVLVLQSFDDLCDTHKPLLSRLTIRFITGMVLLHVHFSLM
ncbi:hypothetical protein [Desulfolucanica intricata]|uniref:hypothetical protein n=1 Tax=Desulfolucanica intricata TaxID=1285191 RepID=UPI000ACE0E9E|nr:hypothetical protein [Desulfolucanica intricata]